MAGQAEDQAPSRDGTIRLILVEPRALVGVGVRELLDREPDIELIGEVRSADDAISMVAETLPNVVLIDIAAQESTTSDGTMRLASEAPGPAIIVIDGQDDDSNILGAVEIGATARVSEVAEPGELVAVIRRVADGEEPLNDELANRPDLVRRLVESARDGYLAQPDRLSITLTPRELEVLRCVAAGLRNREIGAMLDLSEQTVKNHLSTVMHKLGVPNRTHAVTYAVRQGWLLRHEVGQLRPSALD